MTSNVQRVYEECRENSYQYYVCRVDSPYNILTRDLFNADWDRINKPVYDAKVQEMQSKVTTSNAQCESTNGAAVANREKMSQFMGEMDAAYKSAVQCECQLSSNGSNCGSIVGPADCAANPSLAGCAKATINCVSASDNSKQCVCFKNPQSEECLGIVSLNAQKVTETNVSGFAAAGTNGPGTASTVTPFATTGSNGAGIGNVTNGLNNSEVTPFAASASGSPTTADAGSPDGKAGVPGSPGGGSANFGQGDAGGAGAASEDGNYKSISGLFNIAKGAISGVFGKKKDSSEGGKPQYDADGNLVTSINSKKWRPRGLGRGLASDGSETELAGKFEDIWKVMNKQYKVQDQKDSFIFGGEKN